MNEPIGHVPEELREELLSPDDELVKLLQTGVERFFPGRYPHVNREWFDGITPPDDGAARGKILIFADTELAEASQLDKHSTLAFIYRRNENSPNTGFVINYYNSPEPAVPPSRRVKGTTVSAPVGYLWGENHIDFALEKTRIFQEGITVDEAFEDQPFGWEAETNRALTLKEVVSAHQADLKNAKEAKKKKQPAITIPDRSVVTLFESNPDGIQSLVLTRVDQNSTYTALDGNTYTSEAIKSHLNSRTELGAQVLVAELVRMEAYEALLRRMKLL